MKKLIFLFCLAFFAACSPSKNTECTIVMPAKMRYNIPNESRKFGEPRSYHLLQFLDDDDSLRILLFTDSSLAEHLNRAKRKGY